MYSTGLGVIFTIFIVILTWFFHNYNTVFSSQREREREREREKKRERNETEE